MTGTQTERSGRFNFDEPTCFLLGAATDICSSSNLPAMWQDVFASSPEYVERPRDHRAPAFHSVGVKTTTKATGG
jgi:hypothetical protein